LIDRARASGMHYQMITDPFVVGWAILNTLDDSLTYVDRSEVDTPYGDMYEHNVNQSAANIKAGRLKANQATDNTTRAIIVYVHGDEYAAQFEISRPFIEMYAAKCDAELVVLT